MGKVVIVTHTEDERKSGKSDPGLTQKGLADFTKMANALLILDQFSFDFDFREVIIGKGTRFDQMYRLGLLKVFPELPRRRSLLLANPVFTDDKRKAFNPKKGDWDNVRVDPDGTEFPSCEEIPVDESIPPLVWWDWFLKQLIDGGSKGDKLCLAGRGILHALGAPKGRSYSNRVFVADYETRTIRCIMENGELLQKPTLIPLQLGVKHFMHDDFRSWERIIRLMAKALDPKPK